MRVTVSQERQLIAASVGGWVVRFSDPSPRHLLLHSYRRVCISGTSELFSLASPVLSGHLNLSDRWIEIEHSSAVRSTARL